ncbi:MAG TPA: hypothetical protein VGG40_00910 [Solirubrobacterales bacterium]
MSIWKPSTRSLATAALVFAVLAFVVAMIGVATAKPTRVIVRRGDIQPGAVTAKDLAKGAVHARAIAKGAIHGSAIANGAINSSNIANEAIHPAQLAPESVGGRALTKGSVGTAALANDAVTAAQLAPESVYGGALGKVTLVTKPIADLDAVAHNGEWTASNTEVASCGSGEPLIGSGFAMTSVGNGQVGWLQALPIVNASLQGVAGRITSDSGGTASAEVVAQCLK